MTTPTPNPCPVEAVLPERMRLPFTFQVAEACKECPNRAPTAREAELRECLRDLLAGYDELNLPYELCAATRARELLKGGG